MPFECPTCHKEFASKRGMRSHHSQVHSRSLIEAKCEICGKVFSRWTDNDRFCSRECAGVYLNKLYNQGKTAICETCGKEFHISPSHPHRFCSRKCYRGVFRRDFAEKPSLSIIPIDKAKLLDLIKRSSYGTGTLAKAAKIHPDELQRLIGRKEGKFPLVSKLEAILGSFRKKESFPLGMQETE